MSLGTLGVSVGMLPAGVQQPGAAPIPRKAPADTMQGPRAHLCLHVRVSNAQHAGQAKVSAGRHGAGSAGQEGQGEHQSDAVQPCSVLYRRDSAAGSLRPGNAVLRVLPAQPSAP